MARSQVIDSHDTYALQTLARHQTIRRLLSDVIFDITVCQLEGWNPYEFIEMLENELSNIRQTIDRRKNNG